MSTPMLTTIDFKIIPHQNQRYSTCGDYWIENDVLHFRVSELSDWRYCWLIFFHEVIEYLLITLAGIPIAQIDAFDIEYKGQGEPGDSKDAPYYLQHQIATGFERLLAPLL